MDKIKKSLSKKFRKIIQNLQNLDTFKNLKISICLFCTHLLQDKALESVLIKYSKEKEEKKKLKEVFLKEKEEKENLLKEKEVFLKEKEEKENLLKEKEELFKKKQEELLKFIKEKGIDIKEFKY